MTCCCWPSCSTRRIRGSWVSSNNPRSRRHEHALRWPPPQDLPSRTVEEAVPRYLVASELCLPYERLLQRRELGSFVGLAEAETFAAAASLHVLDGTGPNRVVIIDRANGALLARYRRLEE